MIDVSIIYIKRKFLYTKSGLLSKIYFSYLKWIRFFRGIALIMKKFIIRASNWQIMDTKRILLSLNLHLIHNVFT